MDSPVANNYFRDFDGAAIFADRNVLQTTIDSEAKIPLALRLHIIVDPKKVQTQQSASACSAYQTVWLVCLQRALLNINNVLEHHTYLPHT